MNELMLRELLERAGDGEPPTGLRAQNVLRLGVRLRRRRQLRAAVSSAAAIAVTGVSVPAVLGAVGSPSPSLAASGGRHIAYVVTGKDCGISDEPAMDAKCRRETPDGAVMVLDTTTGKILSTIKIPPGPLEAALTPDGKTLYVSTDSGIVPVDLTAGRAGPAIGVDEDSAESVKMVMTPDGKTLYVSSYLANKVIPISTATNTAGAAIRVGPRPDNMAITPDGKTLYVSDSLANTVTPIDTATNAAGKPILIADPKVYGHVFPGPIAMTPDGKTAYVASWEHVTPISTATNTVGTPIRVGFNSNWLTVSPDGSNVYAMDEAYRCHLLPISTATNKPGAPISDPEQPCEPGELVTSGGPADTIAFAPRGATAYVADSWTRQVLPFSTAAGTAAAPIRLPEKVGYSMAITPNGKTLYVTSANGDAITPINTRTRTVEKPIDLGVYADVILMAR